jgi:hypothetical protein
MPRTWTSELGNFGVGPWWTIFGSRLTPVVIRSEGFLDSLDEHAGTGKTIPERISRYRFLLGVKISKFRTLFLKTFSVAQGWRALGFLVYEMSRAL